MVIILVREGEYRRTTGRFYVVVVQAVLLFGSETWVVTPRLEKALAGFHHRAVQWMAGMGPESQLYRTWVYPPIGEALEMLGLDEIGVYIDRRQNTVAQYIAPRPIMELCMAVERRMGMRLSRRWWDKPTLDILWIIAGHAAEKMGEEMGTE